MKRYYFDVVDMGMGQLVTIYAEINGKFISLYGPFHMKDEDEAFALVSYSAQLEAAGYTYVKQSDL